MSLVVDKTRIHELGRTARVRNLPTNVMLEVTHRCNLRCVHCYVVPDGRPELSVEEIRRILREAADEGGLYLTLTGGEAVLRSDLMEIIAAARELNFFVRMFTNGTLMTEELADQLVSASVYDVGVSIYGANAATHDAVTRVEGSFDASVCALRMLHERGVRTALKCVLMDSNIGEHAAIIELARELGAVPQFDFHVTPRVDGDTAPCELSADEALIAALPGLAEGARVEFCDLGSMLPCAAGRDLVCISPSGALSPCVQFPTPVGDLREDSFSDTWNSPRMETLRSLRLTDVARCPECEDLEFCRPCIGLNLLEAGDMVTPAASSCRQARTRRRSVQQ